MAKNGEPEGIARAVLPPSKQGVSESFSFSYDAKSSLHGKAQTGNCNTAGLVRHREDNSTDYILLVAPGFQTGALEQECTQHGITPIRAADLARLLVLSAEFGAIPLTKLREMFKSTTPDDVAKWIDKLGPWLKQNRKISLSDLVNTFQTLEEGFPDVVSASVIADRCRKVTGNKNITASDVKRLIAGLQIVVPDLIQIDGEQVAVTAHPNKLTDAISSQLQKLKATTQ
jgi:hypothetical protein